MTTSKTLDTNSFKTLIDVEKFQELNINDKNYININGIMPLSNVQNTLQNKIFILSNMFIYGGLINNPYDIVSLNDKTFDSLNVDSLDNDVTLICYKHFNTVIYSNIITNFVYLIFNYINFNILESDISLKFKGEKIEIPDIYGWALNSINDIINNNYTYFTDMMNKIHSKLLSKEITTIEINIVEKLMNDLFTNISNVLISKLNKTGTASFIINQSEIQLIFDRDFKVFSELRQSYFTSFTRLFQNVIQNNTLTNPMYKLVTGYFDDSNKPDDYKWFYDDIATFYRITPFLSKNILELNKQQENSEKISVNEKLIITCLSVADIVLKISDTSILLLNLSQICDENDSNNLKFNDIYAKNIDEMKGGVIIPIPAAAATWASYFGAVEYTPILVEGLKGGVEIVKAGQNIPGVGIVNKIVVDEAGKVVGAHITHWAAQGTHMATEVLSYTAGATLSISGAAIVGVVATVAVAGTAYYYRYEIAEALGYGEKVSLPSGEQIGEDIDDKTTIPLNQDARQNEQPTKFDANASIESPEMVKSRQEKEKTERETDKQQQDQRRQDDTKTREEQKEEFRKQQEDKRIQKEADEKQKEYDDKDERTARKEEFRRQQEINEDIKRMNVPTFSEYKMNEFNQQTRNLATRGLGMDERFGPGRALGSSSSGKPNPIPVPGKNIDISNVMADVNSALFLINVGVKFWRRKKGLPDDDTANLAREFVNKNLKMDYIPFYTAETSSSFLPSEIEDTINQPLLPVDFNRYDMSVQPDFSATDAYSQYDMGLQSKTYSYMPYTNYTTDIYSQYDMAGLQTSVEDEVEDEPPPLVPSDTNIDSLIIGEDEEVKNLAIKYNAKTPEDIIKIKKIIANNKYNESGYTHEITIINPTKIETGITTFTPLKATQKFQSSNDKPSSRGILNTLNKRTNFFSSSSSSSNTNTTRKVGGGGVLNTVLSLSLFNFFINLIDIRIDNGQLFFLVPNNVSQNIINKLSIYNSINYLETIKDIQSIYNNTTSYQNINNYLIECNTSLSNFMSVKTGGKTIKNYKKNKNTKKKKNKKHKKTNKKLCKRKKYTRKN